MRLLLDTHVVLWWLSDAPALNEEARTAIADSENMVYVSTVTVWEIAVKRALGKLDISDDWYAVLSKGAFRQLSITWDHARTVGDLPDLHRDPFDRLLVAQAMVEDLVVVTHDTDMLQYGVRSIAT